MKKTDVAKQALSLHKKLGGNPHLDGCDRAYLTIGTVCYDGVYEKDAHLYNPSF